MLSVDSETLWRLAPHQARARAVRQREIIDGVGTAFAALDRSAINTPLRIGHVLAQVGPATELAVRHFQATARLEPDGDRGR